MDSIDEIEGVDDSCIYIVWSSRGLEGVLAIIEDEVGRCLIGSPIRIAHGCLIASDGVIPTTITQVNIH